MSRFIKAWLGWDFKDSENQGNKFKIPSTKSQIPNKFKKSNYKSKIVLNLCFWISDLFGAWNLEFGAYLGFGIWYLDFNKNSGEIFRPPRSNYI
jgi:hypothetical protein